jgi:hypothetical protein
MNMKLLQISALALCLNITAAHANDYSNGLGFSGYLIGSSLAWAGTSQLMNAWLTLNRKAKSPSISTDNPNVQISQNEIKKINETIVSGATTMTLGLAVVVTSFMFSNMLADDCDKTRS